MPDRRAKKTAGKRPGPSLWSLTRRHRICEAHPSSDAEDGIQSSAGGASAFVPTSESVESEVGALKWQLQHAGTMHDLMNCPAQDALVGQPAHSTQRL